MGPLLGIQSIGGVEDVHPTSSFVDVLKTPLDPDVGAVVTGLDVNLNYRRLATAQSYIQRGALFIATNTDVNFPFASGDHTQRLLPGAGSIVKALETCTQKTPFVVGKPSGYFLELIELEHHIDKSKTVFIGDNLHTDILFGNGLGIQTIFVTTGVSKLEDMDTYGIYPSYVVHGVQGLVEGINN